MAGPGGAKVVNLQKNLLAQQLNFSPGTSLAGSFGTTDSRFKLEPSEKALVEAVEYLIMLSRVGGDSPTGRGAARSGFVTSTTLGGASG